jgi:hypothetical protein
MASTGRTHGPAAGDMQYRVSRVPLLVPVTALALVVAGCSSGSTTTPTPSGAPTSVGASRGASAAAAFPGDQDGPALAAARQFVEKVTTYDHTKLDDQLKTVLPLTGEPLKGELRKSLSGDGDFATSTRENARDAKGTVVDLGMVSRQGNVALVVAFVDQQITSPAGQSTLRLRERVTLDKSRGPWLATKLETL